MDIKELANKTADFLETANWVNYCPKSEHKEYCLLTAISHVAGPWRTDDFYNLKSKLYLKIGRISKWNDQRGRTKQEVLDLLRSIS